MTTSHFTNKFQINNTTRLSVAQWVDGSYTRTSAIVERKINGKWRLDHDTAVEGGAQTKVWEQTYSVPALRFSDAVYEKIKAEYAAIGQEMPLRFYTETIVTK